MGSKLYVGNLLFNTTEADLKDAFGAAGKVESVELIQDKFSGKSRGFGFVTMASDQDAQNAITQFHGKEVDGRALTVNEARPREERPQGGGGGGGGRRIPRRGRGRRGGLSRGRWRWRTARGTRRGGGYGAGRRTRAGRPRRRRRALLRTILCDECDDPASSGSRVRCSVTSRLDFA